MRLLFDPIYSQQPRRCSSASKYRKLAQRLLDWRPDVYIYWRIPEWSDAEDLEWLPKSDRIRYLKVPCCFRDRTKEYWHFPADLEDQVGFCGSTWDFDVILTMRTGQVPTMRLNMSSPRASRTEWSKSVFLLEEMAITTWRKTVAVSSYIAQDPLTYLGYLTSDQVYITAEHVRDGVLRGARAYFAPSKVIEMTKKMHLVNPTVLDLIEDKAPEFRYNGTTPFRAFVAGRLSGSSSGAEESLAAFEKHWIWHGEEVSPGITTQGQVAKVEIPSMVEVQHNDRDAFWKCLREQAHVVVKNSPDGEFALVLIEPLCLGVPAIVIDAEWSRGLLGPDYPFYAKGEAQIYGWMSLFKQDYETHYATFLAWRNGAFKDRMTTGAYKENLYDRILSDLGSFEDRQRTLVQEKWKTRSVGQLITALREHVGDRTHIVIEDEFKEFCTAARFPTMHAKLRDPEKFKSKVTTSFYEDWNTYRLMMIHMFGWRDGGTRTGELVRA